MSQDNCCHFPFPLLTDYLLLSVQVLDLEEIGVHNEGSYVRFDCHGLARLRFVGASRWGEQFTRELKSEARNAVFEANVGDADAAHQVPRGSLEPRFRGDELHGGEEF